MGVDAGLMIKKVRKELGLSQKDTAQRAGITASLLSQIENKKTNVSLSTLEKISKALDTPVSAFISLEPVESDSLAQIPGIPRWRESAQPDQLYDPVAHKDLRPAILLSGGSVQLELLTPGVNRKLGVYKKILEVNQTFDGLDYSAPVEQLIYVISGMIQVQLLSGEYYLNPGYSIHFGQDNYLKNVTGVSASEPAVFILFSSPPIY